MSVLRKRYYLWLLKAYIRKWKKTIASSLILGIAIFFGAVALVNFFVAPILLKKVTKIGYAGAYTPENLPPAILKDVSFGLTKVAPDGSIRGAAAQKWNVEENGKRYVFFLKKGLRFQNGKELTAETLSLAYKDVARKNKGRYEVSYELKNSYSPFLATVSRPIFINSFIGLGEYKIKKMDLNASFVRSLTLQSTKDPEVKKIISFYPTKEALKTAFLLGEIDTAVGISDTHVFASQLSQWKNVTIQKKTNYGELVALFYNTDDEVLSNKKVREGLTYALPETFGEGERAYSPIPPTSLYFSKPPNYGISDVQIGQELLASSKVDFKKSITITTTESYKGLAEKIQRKWKEEGVNSKLQIVPASLPTHFQVFLYRFRVPADPDQYTLWHTGQTNNITHYKNVRIDKLLEDGRSATDLERRQTIYADFQKYIIDDAPAAFLYFPYEYTVSRR